MDYDVFISHSSKDADHANAICTALERDRIRCWIAPRDITAGDDWSGAIIDAIDRSKVLLLVFTKDSNDSDQVRHEVERAINNGRMILVFRLDDVPYSKSLEYFLSSRQWIDAHAHPLEQSTHKLSDVLNKIRFFRVYSGSESELDTYA